MRVIPASEIPASELDRYIRSMWHADVVVAHGEAIRPAGLPGYVALDEDRIAGHASYRVAGDACELVAIVAKPPRRGAGTELLERVLVAAREAGCASVWLTTTNDNLEALRFYQRRGFRITAVRPGAVTEARRALKPEIPEIGSSGIPMRDEIDLAIDLDAPLVLGAP